MAGADRDGGGTRYGMLEPVRQYAGEKLEESGEADLVSRSHAAFFLALAERAYPELPDAESTVLEVNVGPKHQGLPDLAILAPLSARVPAAGADGRKDSPVSLRFYQVSGRVCSAWRPGK